MNDIEKRILNELQDGIPISERPFLEIAEKLEVKEEEVIICLRKLKQEGLVRRFGGILDVNKIGAVSTLACIKVKEEESDELAEYLNSYVGITHNYKRDDEYRLWFTLMEPSKESLERVISEIGQMEQVEELISLPAVRKHKTKVFLKFE